VMNELGQQIYDHVEKERLAAQDIEASIRKLRELGKKAEVPNTDPIYSVHPNYHKLATVFAEAIDQAARGKGRERHASDEAFEDQLICFIARHLGINAGVLGGPLFQVIKKAFEVTRLPTKEAKLRELYGVMNYAAAAAILVDESP
jgi:hypothetical protein